MISVPSHLPLSSGNRWGVILLYFIFLMGCSSSTTSTARTKVIKPDTSLPNAAEESEKIEVDTIQWTFRSEETYPPISASSRVASYEMAKVEKDYYKIALLLPMRLQQDIATLDANNRKFADFYAGIKMAAERQSNLRAEIKVYYTDRDEERFEAVLDDIRREIPDLIIASYESSIISKTATFGLENRIPVISPWKSSNNITEDNLFFLQIRPSIKHYYERIVSHIRDRFDRDEVVVIQRPDRSDRSKVALVQQVNEELSERPIVTPIETFEVALDSLMDPETTVFDTALVDGVKAFILPHYSARDESFIYSCLRKLYGEKAGRECFVYTMPVALKSERVDINILKNLDIRTAEYRFPDLQDSRVQQFRKNYYQEHGWLPTEDAYYGYDLMTFITYGLLNHGQYFHYFMAGEELDLMQMSLHIQPFYKQRGGERPDFLVNDHLYIIEYNEDHFEVGNN